jgi:tRNA(fMet)-specific endonuclease VapC
LLHLLDTDTASYIIKRRDPAIEARLSAIEPSQVCISVITRAELMYGLKRLPAGHRLHVAVRQFLRIVRTLPWAAESADLYADIRHQLETSGQLIGELDMMIAAQALSVGAVLVTNNTRHFERIEAPLILANWTQPQSDRLNFFPHVTGMGLLAKSYADGEVVTDDLAGVAHDFGLNQLTTGSFPLDILSAGQAPNMAAGVVQLRGRIPLSFPPWLNQASLILQVRGVNGIAPFDYAFANGNSTTISLE